MSSSRTLSRRTLTKGAAWAAPIVAASATVPAYAASSSNDPKNYLFGRQAKATYAARWYNGSCYSNVATFSTANLNFLPWASGHGIVYAEGEGVPTTATLKKYTITVAFPKGTTSGKWSIDNNAWSVEKIALSYMTDSSNMGTDNLYVGNMDVYRFTFNGTRSANVGVISANAAWPGGTFTATDSTTRSNCLKQNTGLTYYIQFDWDFTTANGYADASTDASIATQ